MSSPHADASVRPGNPADATAIAAVQQTVWRDGYGQLLPEPAATSFDLVTAQASWSAAITSPPSPRHHVLVASAGSSVVGFAAVAPASDPDLDPESAAELVVLHVDPAVQRRGHGSRLMSAAVDVARADGFHRLVTWVFAADDPMRTFLRESGWDADGSTRDLDVGELVHQVRLQTVIEQPSNLIA